MFSGILIKKDDSGQQFVEVASIDEAQLPDGDVTIDVDRLELLESATIASLTLSDADAGDVSINAGNLAIRGDAIRPIDHS